jgi:hypothetical protein
MTALSADGVGSSAMAGTRRTVADRAAAEDSPVRFAVSPMRGSAAPSLSSSHHCEQWTGKAYKTLINRLLAGLQRRCSASGPAIRPSSAMIFRKPLMAAIPSTSNRKRAVPMTWLFIASNTDRAHCRRPQDCRHSKHLELAETFLAGRSLPTTRYWFNVVDARAISRPRQVK